MLNATDKDSALASYYDWLDENHNSAQVQDSDNTKTLQGTVGRIGFDLSGGKTYYTFSLTGDTTHVYRMVRCTLLSRHG